MEISILIAGILTLAIFTFLYKDNPIYKMAESLLIGVSIGYFLVITWTNSLMSLLFHPLIDEGKFSLLIPMSLGLLMFARFSKKRAYLSRLPIAVLIGSGAGVAIPAMLGARILSQITATISPVIRGGGINISGIIVLTGVLCTLSYFYFSREHKGFLGHTAKAGTWFLMLFFGTTFGYTVMSRMSTLIGRVEFLLTDFLMLTN